MEHRASRRHQGVHAAALFKVLLAESTPAYTAAGSNGTEAVELSAKQMRTGIEKEYGMGETLEQMFTPNLCSRHGAWCNRHSQ